LEEKATTYLYEMVAEDLNPRLDLQSSSPLTEEEQVARYYRNHPANQNKNNSSYQS
jgi:hypothetical protein